MVLSNDLVACGAVRFGTFTLTSGRASPYYVDIKSASSRPDVLGRIAQAFSQRIGDAQGLAGVELGAVPLLVAVSLQTGLPYAILRKRSREHGTGKPIEGADVKGRRVLVLEDVTTTGGSVVQAIHTLREAGAVVDRVETVVDRGEGAEAALREVDARLGALVTAQDLLALAKEARV